MSHDPLTVAVFFTGGVLLGLSLAGVAGAVVGGALGAVVGYYAGDTIR